MEFLIEQYAKFPSHTSYQGDDEEEKRQFITLPPSHFNLAMYLGHTEIMGYLIAKTGAEFPFSALMKIAGVEVEKKSKVRGNFWRLSFLDKR